MTDKHIGTEGGTYVQRDAVTGGGAFTGRDYQKIEGGVILNFDDPRDQQAVITEKTLRELVENVKRLIIVIDGDVNYDSPGMRAKVKDLDIAQAKSDAHYEDLKIQVDRIANWNRFLLAAFAALAAVEGWQIFLK